MRIVEHTERVMAIRATIARMLAATERAASQAADARWAAGRLRRDERFTERSRDNRLAHQRRVDSRRRSA